MSTDAALREQTIPHLAGTLDAPEPPAPRLLVGGADWRIVRVVSPAGEVKQIVEVTDGRDLLGGVRWQAVTGQKDGISTYMRVIAALVDLVTKDMEP